MHYKKLIPLAFALSSCTPLPAQVNENFSDGDFILNPTWNGSNDEFIVNATKELQLNNVVGGQSQLSTSSIDASINYKEWRISVKQTFAGSDNNHSRIYLISNGSDLSFANAISGSSSTGYFLKLGEAGSTDAIKFFRDDGPIGIVELASGTAGLIASSFNINIQVLRDNVGNWNINVDPTGGTNFSNEISIFDNTYTEISFLGVSCIYTASNATKFYFDNIYFGNPIIPAIPNTPNVRSVVLNEIYADPTPSNGLPDAEYIELFNADSIPFELSGWKLVNSLTEKTLPTFLLNPNEYVIICDANNTSWFPNSIGIASLTALTNSGDSLTLLDFNNNVIDMVSYTDDWYNSSEKSDGGWSLEQINPYKICSGQLNWSASNNVSGGTPGFQNSIYNNSPDTEGPQLLSWNLNQANQLTLQFNESINVGNSNSFVCGNAQISTVQYLEGNTMVVITFTSNLQPETTYTLSQTNLEDCEGNSSNITFDIYQGKTPEFGDLILTEILADPDPVVQGIPSEFIEIFNNSSHTLELKGLSINSSVFEGSHLLFPNEYLVVGDLSEALSFLSVSNKLLVPSFPTLTNSGMLLKLSMNGMHLDSIRYSIDWFNNSFKANGGWSLELVNPNLPCSNARNWKPCENEMGNTPGEQNSVFSNSPDIEVPELLYITTEDSAAVLHFNEAITLNGDLFQEENLVGNFVVENPSSQIILNNSALLNSEIFTYALHGISDCSGNSTSVSFEWGFPENASSGNLVINEILFNPYANGSDFVELHNTASYAVSIANLSIANGYLNTGSENEIATTEGRIILPHEFIVFTEDGTDLVALYPSIQAKNIIRVNALPAFNNASGTCVIYSNQNEIIDEFNYTESMHFQLLSSFEGVSLERLSPELPTTQESNWHSASEACGYATPGIANSQIISVENMDGDFSLSTQIFSPDNDGLEDVIQFHFSNLKSGSVGNLTIYNERGIRVKRLIRNEYLGTKGNAIWDGLSDEGEPLEIGIYIATFEAFNQDGIQVRHKRDFTLARKR
ncbi:MAG: lamin tail domain-containing protein [Flavobacteriales bacterium]|nr:lamin tail domain-containing protein [Flavobacteriales bacterium]